MMTRAGWLALAANSVACGEGVSPRPESGFERQELLDPETCRSCHPGQYQEWAGSMHAYASQDPVFIAMNARGQQETAGALGSFCVNCHAPVAVRENSTEDGLNLADLDAPYRGVTCYFCHNTEAVEGVHNNPLVLANDRTMRGPFSDPVATDAHTSAYSPHLDSRETASSALCGACHDVTLPAELGGREVALERTYAEWRDSLFARAADEAGLGCNGCHMPASPTRQRAAEVPMAPRRASSRHDFEGVDLALDAFPNRERQRLLVERLLGSTLLAEICVAETGVIEVTLENAGAGHHFPSGASHDREAWLEVEAFSAAQDEPVFRTVAPEAEDQEAERVVLKDHVVDAEGNPAHMFWDIADVDSSTTLPGVRTRDPLDPEFHRERRVWTFNANQASVQRLARVTLKVRVRPIALAVLDDLVLSGHLEPEIAAAMPVIDVLPNRCYDAETIQRHPDLLEARATCNDSEANAFTLVWESGAATPENPTFRASRVAAAPARCLSHPTYVSIAAVP